MIRPIWQKQPDKAAVSGEESSSDMWRNSIAAARQIRPFSIAIDHFDAGLPPQFVRRIASRRPAIELKPMTNQAKPSSYLPLKERCVSKRVIRRVHMPHFRHDPTRSLTVAALNNAALFAPDLHE